MWRRSLSFDTEGLKKKKKIYVSSIGKMMDVLFLPAGFLFKY